jgi:YbbR domain-containing protein
MIRWIGTNIRTFVWAFLLALAVWVAAVSAADPDEVRQYPDPITVEIIGQDPGMVITGVVPQQIELVLRAPRSVWGRLLSEENTIRAILDLSGLSSGEHTLQIQVQVPIRPVRIESVTPSTVTLTLEALATRTLPVELTVSGEPALGYLAGEAGIEPAQIVLSGPLSMVEQVSSLHASVSLEGLRESIEASFPVTALDESGQPVNEVGLNPAEVQVTLPVLLQGGYRDLAVKVVVRGQVASGYRLANISVSPPVVTVFSNDAALVNALPGVLETQPLELDNANDDLSTRLALALPEGVSLVGEQTVLVQVGISPIQSSLTLENKAIEIIGLPDGWFIQVAPSVVDVILSGPLPLLDTLSPQDVRVEIDVTGLAEGIHQLTPNVEILIANISVESILPGTVEIVLSSTEFTTPTPAP